MADGLDVIVISSIKTLFRIYLRVIRWMARNDRH